MNVNTKGLWPDLNRDCKLNNWRRTWQPAPVFLPEKSHGWRNLAAYSLWGFKESDTAERLLS